MPDSPDYLAHIRNLSAGKDPLAVQARSPAILAELISNFPSDRLTSRPASGKWSVAEILAHLAEDEIATGWRADWPEFKERFAQVAKAQGLSESALLRPCVGEGCSCGSTSRGQVDHARPVRLSAADRSLLFVRFDLHQRGAERDPVARFDEDAGDHPLDFRLDG